MSELTHLRLKQILNYDEVTGLFTWIKPVCRGRAKHGGVAGTKNKRGYIIIRIDGAFYKAHRLAWLYTEGKWPDNEIDHIDGNTSNNARSNLRDITHRANCQNKRKANSNSELAILGVKTVKKTGRFRAVIGVDYKQVHLGSYATVDVARAAYIDAKRKLHEGNTL
jgi:hypothetical protein